MENSVSFAPLCRHLADTDADASADAAGDPPDE